MRGTCTKCSKEILWAISEKGAKVPLDPKALIFKVYLSGDDVKCVPADKDSYMVTHFATCEFASEFSGKSKKAETPAQSEGSGGTKGKAHYTDEDLFPFGKYKDKAFGAVPSYYLDWLRGQPWINEWPGIAEYIDEDQPTGKAIDKDVERGEPPTSSEDQDNIPF